MSTKSRFPSGRFDSAGQVGADAVRGVERQQCPLAAVDAVIGTVGLERQVAGGNLLARGRHVIDGEGNVVDARLPFASDIGIAALEQRQRRLADTQKWDRRPARRAMRRPCHSEVFSSLPAAASTSSTIRAT